MKKDLSFQAISLFSQYLGEIEPIFQKTACMNPDDAETIGLLLGLADMTKNEKAKTMIKEKLVPFLETVANARWTGKGELTHLGFRLTHRHRQTIDLSSDTITETEIASSEVPEE